MSYDDRERTIGIIVSERGAVVFDHSLYSPTELEVGIVEFAIHFGLLEQRYGDDAETHRDLWDSLVSAPSLTGEMETHLAGWHDEALEYLNDHVCPPGYAWYHDGEAGVFGCFKIEEDDK